MESILSALIGVLLGGIITIAVSRKYFIKSSLELKVEASKLRAYNKLILRALEYTGLAKFTKDGQGDFKGLLLELKATASVKTKASDIDLKINGNDNNCKNND